MKIVPLSYHQNEISSKESTLNPTLNPFRTGRTEKGTNRTGQ